MLFSSKFYRIQYCMFTTILVEIAVNFIAFESCSGKGIASKLVKNNILCNDIILASITDTCKRITFYMEEVNRRQCKIAYFSSLSDFRYPIYFVKYILTMEKKQWFG